MSGQGCFPVTIEAARAAADPETLLLFEMLLGTGQRISDVLAMQWGQVEDGGIWVKQGKT
jgi:integrase